MRNWLDRIPGGRRLPPWFVGYLAVVVMAVGAILLVAAAGSCVGMLEDAARRLALAVQTVLLAVLGLGVLRLGVQMMGRDDG